MFHEGDEVNCIGRIAALVITYGQSEADNLLIKNKTISDMSAYDSLEGTIIENTVQED